MCLILGMKEYTKHTRRLLLSIHKDDFKILGDEARTRKMNIQELIRFEIIPAWLKEKGLMKTKE